LNVKMKRSTAMSAITPMSCGSRMWRKICVGVAPSTLAASSSSGGAACSRARMNRNANGNDFHASKTITVSSAVGTPRLIPNNVIVPFSWLRKGIGAFQPRMSVPIALTKPSWGESSTCQTNVTATTGATHGSSSSPRTIPRPRKERRTRRAAVSPSRIAPSVPNTEYSSVVLAASKKPEPENSRS
jgi:hypothetical protein